MTIVVDRGTDADVGVNNFDGVIEPLTIRDIVALRTTPRAAVHRVCGAAADGNAVNRDSADQIVVIAKHSDYRNGTLAQVDNVDSVGQLITSAEILSVDSRNLAPFVENYEVKGVITSTNMPSDLIAAVRAMNPGTENSRYPDYDQLGETGFPY